MNGKLPAALAVIFVLLISACTSSKAYMPEAAYYIDSVSGDDSSSGLSPDNSWRSIDKLNLIVMAPGSTVLFKSGQTFRGSLKPSSGTAEKPVAYSFYGGEEKPVLQNSIDLSAASDWENIGNNIWKANASFSMDVGNIIFDDSSCGLRRWSLAEMTDKSDFFFDSFWKTLHLKSGINPGELYGTVEAALTDHVIDQSNVTYATFTGLHVRYGGAHGFGGGETEGIVISACEISFMGGGFLYYNNGEPVRYGNGVEFWGGASGNTVEDCYIHDIYDTGVTNQNHSSTAVQKDIIYRNNIIENCGLASFEFWNRPASSSISNVLFENNTCINPGNGWGEQRPDLHGSHVSVFGNEAVLDDVVIRNNIFFGGNMIYFFDEGVWTSTEVIADYNCLYPVADGEYDYLCLVWDDNSIETSDKYESGALSDLRTASGRESNSISSDPLFTEAAFPWEVSSDSEAYGMGASGF